MSRLIIYIIGTFLLAQVNALALNCNLSKIQLGKSKLDFEKEKEIFLIQKVNEKISSLVVPIEYVCEKSDANGTFIALFFYNDKVIRILYENVINEKKPLFRVANENYKVGFKANKKIINANEPEQYALEKNGIYFLYANIKGINENKGNFFELFEIVDRKFEDIMNEEMLKMEGQ